MYSKRYNEALEFAAMAHAGQLRKGTNIPYITHPVSVARLLALFEFDETTQLVGLLHDVLEDTPATFEDLERNFGTQIATDVRWCSEPSASPPWSQRKREAVLRMAKAPPLPRAVMTADKIHNVSTLADALEAEGAAVWERFRAGRAAQVQHYANCLEALRQGVEGPLIEALEGVLARLRQIDSQMSGGV